MKYITLVPCYGRDYKYKKEVVEAWEGGGGKDFRIMDISSPEDGRVVNRSQLEGKPITLNIRFKNLTQICVIKPNC